MNKLINKSLAVVFPGQGSQAIGMLDAIANEPTVKKTLDEANDALSFNLAELMASGPIETLNQTEFTQPAMLTAGIALWRLWQECDLPQPGYLAGHSLGEFSALVAADVLSFVDALRLVRKRGQLMQSAVPVGAGAMAAIMGLEASQIEQLCQIESTKSDAKVYPANYNAPDQTVIAGTRAAVEALLESAKIAGAKRVLLLPVSVPAHTPLMQPAVEPLAAAFNLVSKKEPQIPIMSFRGTLYKNNTDITAALPQQLISPVRWTQMINTLCDAGVKVLIECGPGKILQGLNRRISKERGTLCETVFDLTTLESVRQLLVPEQEPNHVHTHIRHQQ